MDVLLITIVIALFVGMLFINVYFRVKVMKSYKKLVQNGVEFESRHFFNKKMMEEEVYPKYPEMAPDIKIFVSHIRYSVRMASVLIILITIFGGILMYFR